MLDKVQGSTLHIEDRERFEEEGCLMFEVLMFYVEGLEVLLGILDARQSPRVHVAH